MWPAVFSTGSGAIVRDESGRAYIDFFSGAGALNYGHNNPYLKEALVDYLNTDGIVHGLDMATTAKIELLSDLRDLILSPRGLHYKVQFTGPTGTDAVEAALKMARRASGRSAIVCFTNAFHGVSLGALAVTGNESKRAAAGIPLGNIVRIPFDGFGDDFDGLALLERMLRNGGCGLDRPGGVIVETVQGEGGLNTARSEWMIQLSRLCKEHEMVLIVDDIQMGCGRTGPFFSFEDSGVVPDIVCLSKSIGGFGLPMSLVLIRPELDQWHPGEHSGTFRGNNLAFVTASAAMRRYWSDTLFEESIRERARRLKSALSELAHDLSSAADVRGRGLALGLAFGPPGLASKVCRLAFESGLLIETSGPNNEVVKLLPPP
jgi:diaminobutyrate-2-oxoglutarate transaminase